MWRIRICENYKITLGFHAENGRATGAFETQNTQPRMLAFEIMNMTVKRWRQLMHLLSNFSVISKIIYAILLREGDIRYNGTPRASSHNTITSQRKTRDDGKRVLKMRISFQIMAYVLPFANEKKHE